MKDYAVPVLLGPTAVGKTEVSLAVAKELDAEIIVADSMQVYRGMDIGTDKPSPEELQKIKHYLIDIRDISRTFSVVDFLEEARGSLQVILLKGKIPLIVGGTGMYLRALAEGYSIPQTDKAQDVRAKLEKTADEHGLPALYKRLRNVDPHAASRIHEHDRRRIIRALEVFEGSGHPISKQQKKRRFMEGFDLLLIGLNRPRDELYRRIDERVERMQERGLVKEVKELLNQGLRDNHTAMQALGCKETVAYLDGEISYDKYVEELKKRTRNFARRQLTWFRRFSAKGGSASGGKNVKWFDIDADFSPAQVTSYIRDYLNLTR